MIDPMAAWCESPWYGRLEIVGMPGAWCSWGTECWDGNHVGAYVTDTLRPLTPVAAALLGRAIGDQVWDDRRKRAWENEPISGWWNIDNLLMDTSL